MTLTALRPARPAAAGGGPTDTGAAGVLARGLARMQESLAELAETPTFGLSGEDLNRLVERCSAVASSVGELRARLVSEADQRDHATDQGCTSTTAWLRTRTGLSGPAAGRLTAQARQVFTDRAAPTRVAWASGRLSGEQALVIAEAVNRLAADLDPDRVAAAQLDLISQAGDFTVEELRRLANRMIEVVDPDTADDVLAEQLEAEERRALESTRLWFGRCGDGTTRFGGRLPDLQADMFKKAVQALAAPRRQPTGRRDRPRSNGEAASPEAAGPEGAGPGAAGPVAAGPVVAPPAARGPAALGSSPVLNPDGDHSGSEIGMLTAQQRLGRALVELLEHLPGDGLPQAGGLNATVVVSMPLDTLTGGLGPAILDTGTTISGSEARRLACNATLVPLVLGGPSRVLDLGMGQRLFDRYQRLAIIQRDRGCVWPGCDRPPALCESHHLTPWSRGGPTDVSNGALVCGFHHRLLHKGEWAARVAADGVVEIIPPERIDPARRPLRHARFKQRTPC
jgi:hypothetical protein